MRRLTLIFAMVCRAAEVWAADAPYAMVGTDAKRIRATLSIDISAPEVTASEWIVFVAEPPSLPGQREVVAKLTPDGRTYYELGKRRPLLRSLVSVEDSGQKHQFAAKAEFEAQLVARSLVRRTGNLRYAPAMPLTAAERTTYLQKSALVDFATGPFTKWLDEHKLRRGASESDIDFARRAFLAVTKSVAYEYTEKMDRRASFVCTEGRTDCGGMAVLFAAAMRANKIPARCLSGAWAKSADAGDTLGGVRYYQTHVKGEFYADGVGWVPVDPSSAVLHDRSPDGLQYFGRDPGDFLTLHVDPELKIDSVRFGIKTVNWLQQYHFYVYGMGTLKDAKTTVDWQVQTLQK